MTEDRHLHELTAREMAAAVATRSLTPNELVDAALRRIAETEPSLSAWSHLDEDGARRQAEQLTKEAASGRLRGPLHGVPFGAKDEFHVQGMPTRQRGRNAGPEPVDSTIVARLRAAGAIVLGKLHMPVEGITPPTRNPWNLEHTPGGSSSGSGAAVAARMVPFALAEQTSGSGLRPAGFCGVAGLKPTYGRISRFGCFPFTWTMDHPCIIGLDMQDIALVLSQVAGHDDADPDSLHEEAPPADLQLAELRPPRIGLIESHFPELMEPVMRDAIAAAATRFERAGAEVVSVRLPEEFALIWHLHHVLTRTEGAIIADGSSRWDADGGTKEWRLQNVVAGLVPAVYQLHARRLQWRLRRDMARVFDGVDALLTGVAPGAAPRGIGWTGDYSLLQPWSFLGYPAITVNAGLSPERLPLGLQLIAPWKMDYELCRIGAWTESVLGRLPAPAIGAPVRSA